MNVLYTLYETSWNFVSVTVRHDYRNYDNNIWKRSKIVCKSYIYYKRIFGEQLVYDVNSNLEHRISATEVALGILFQFRYQQLPTLLSVLFEMYFN